MARREQLKVAGGRVAAVVHGADDEAESTLDARMFAIRGGVAKRQRRRRAAYALGTVVAAALCLLLVVTLRGPSAGERALAFRVDGAAGETGRFIAASGGETHIAFDDGSSLRLARDGHARVAEVTPRGANVVLEDGSLDVDVVHREETSWQISAGPFAVHVVGTAFRADWSPSDESLTVSMREGVVLVSGACLDRPARVVAGASMQFSCRGVVRDASEPSAQPSANLAAAPAASAATSLGTPDAPDWRALVKRGDFARAYAALESSGELARVGAAEPAARLEIADVARLAGHADVARAVLTALRSDHPSSDAAAVAAFHLGRMSQGREAERWLRLYLDERPSGAFAREALGRLLELERGRPEARATAERYLSLYPDGAHAPLARTILAQ